MYAKYMKRLLDILLSLTILIVLSPLLLVLCILVRSKLGSPIFFSRSARDCMRKFSQCINSAR